jgi:hypothetical protein
VNLDSIYGKKHEFVFQVKQLDQFMNRFNNKENIFAGDEVKNDSLTQRKRTLISLLNHEDSELFIKRTEDFIDYICNDSNHILLDYSDDHWYAKVNCTLQYNDKEKNAFLTLKKEGDMKTGFKWVIVGVNASFIDVRPAYYDTAKFIGPMNHELGFMGLFNIFNDYKNVAEYAYRDFEPDDLSVFFFLIKTKEIQYVKVNSIQYHFLQVTNWIFTVDYFNRPSSNSGWLISSVDNVTDSLKVDYKKNILNTRQ